MGAATAEALQVYAVAGAEMTDETGLSRRAEMELARRVAAGEMPALEEVYGRYRRIIYTLCLRMTRNVAEAEDLSQDIFISLRHKIGSFRGEAALSTWIHRVTVNYVLMHFRKAAVRYEQTTEDGELPVEKVTGAAATVGRISADRIALADAIGKLPPGYRAIFILHDIEGYEHQEVARMCGITAGTSKSQLHKARMRLRQLLKP